MHASYGAKHAGHIPVSGLIRLWELRANSGLPPDTDLLLHGSPLAYFSRAPDPIGLIGDFSPL